MFNKTPSTHSMPAPPAPGPPLLPEEYERRRRFLDGLKTLTKAEHIEIVRILQKHDTEFSENNNGIFFNVSTLSQGVFDALELFLYFTQKNRQNLEDREMYLSTLSTGMTIKMTESKPSTP
jgi:hypothetical protein